MMQQSNLRRLIDLLMIALLPVLMAYSLVGEALHEWLGIAMFLLFICHHALNRKWLPGLFRGRYSPARWLMTVVSLLLVADMFVLPISGILMSKHVFPMLSSIGFAAQARTIHLLGGYWGYVWMSLHLGFHVGRLTARVQTSSVSPAICLLGKIVPFIMAYGIYAFFRRSFAAYLFLRTQFVFLDFAEPRVFFFLDYLSVMVLFAGIGHYLMRILQGRR